MPGYHAGCPPRNKGIRGYRQGLKDGSRARLFDMATLETLHWVGYGTRALILLLAHRNNATEIGQGVVA